MCLLTCSCQSKLVFNCGLYLVLWFGNTLPTPRVVEELSNSQVLLSMWNNSFESVGKRKVLVCVRHLCQTLCDLADHSLPGSSVHGILQARKLERDAIPFSRGFLQHRGQTWVFCIAGRCLTIWATREAHWKWKDTEGNKKKKKKERETDKLLLNRLNLFLFPRIWQLILELQECCHYRLLSIKICQWIYFSCFASNSHIVDW